MGFNIDRLDHFVLTVADIEITCDFYERVMGMTTVNFAGNRKALSFGRQKINLHQAGDEFEPKAEFPTAGSGDLCFITENSIVNVVGHLEKEGVQIEEGPVPRAGATGPIISVYFRDPDCNLIEVSTYDGKTA